MSKLTIEVNEHGVTKVRVDGESLGMMEHFEFSADARKGPKAKVRFILFGSAKEYAEKFLKLSYATVEWLDPDSRKMCCPCGGIILADTEDWVTPQCHECWMKLGSPRQEPTKEYVPIKDQCSLCTEEADGEGGLCSDCDCSNDPPMPGERTV